MAPDAVPGVRHAVTAAGATLLDARFDADGAQVWEEDAPDA
jgi:hypothetical protein